MTDVEELLRETLADPRHRLDPDPQQYERITATVAVLRRQRTRQRLVGVLAGVAVLALLVGAGVVADRYTGRRGGSPAASGTAAPTVTPPAAAPGTAVAVAAAPGALYVLDAPSSLHRLDATLRLTAKARLPFRMTEAAGLAADPSGGYVWVWDRDPRGRTVVSEYGGRTLALVYRTTFRAGVFGGDIFTGVGMDEQLWLATQHGVYLVRRGAATPVPGTRGQVVSLAADPGRGRLLAGLPADRGTEGGYGGVRIVGIDPGPVGVTTRGAVLHLGKESIAVVSGQIWVGGYGTGAVPKLYRLDPKTLRPAGTSPLDQYGPGAVVWPGQAVLWVRDGGSEQLACVDPTSGSILQRWSSVPGPVVSVSGAALAVNDNVGDAYLDNSDLSRLALNAACTG